MMHRSVKQRFSWEEYAEETRRLGAAQSRHLNGNRSATATNQLINLVPSIASNAQGSSSIQQLLSLTGVSLLTPTKTRRSNESEPGREVGANANSLADSDGRQASASNLLTSLKSGTNRFNLKFWQRGSSSSANDDQTPDKVAVDPTR